MARVGYGVAMKETTLTIEDTFLVVDTKQDGYFNIFKGVHPFRVVKDLDGDYAVYPVYWTDEGKLTNEPHPIIRSVGGDIFFVKRTLNDPYNGPDMEKIVKGKKTVEHKVLDAFNVFAQSEFNLGHPNPIHVFIADESEIAIEDAPVEFELRDLKGEVVEEEVGP